VFDGGRLTVEPVCISPKRDIFLPLTRVSRINLSSLASDEDCGKLAQMNVNFKIALVGTERRSLIVLGRPIHSARQWETLSRKTGDTELSLTRADGQYHMGRINWVGKYLIKVSIIISGPSGKAGNVPRDKRSVHSPIGGIEGIREFEEGSERGS